MYRTKYKEFDGNSWEEFCQQCLKIKYKEDYQEIPAFFNGDLGIEGFTRDGLVFQCYCPSENYEQKELYEHQRAKITKDLKKLETNKKALKETLDKVKIKKWIFLTPEYKNKELLSHCMTKKNEILKTKLEILDEDFDVLIQTIDFFGNELSIVLNNCDNKIFVRNEELNEKNINQWKMSNIKNIENVKRKINVLGSQKREKEKWIQKNINKTIEDFLLGEIILSELGKNFNQNYEKLLRFKNSVEKEIENICDDEDLSNKIKYESIAEKLEVMLKDQFENEFELSTILDLKRRILSEWIMNCPIDFYEEE